MKTLSICIPTYNRASLLKDSLSAIVLSIPKDRRDFVEIVISNNDSSDNTKDIIDFYVESNPSILWKIVHQNPNIGPKNTAVVTQYATGEFVWIISDDDIVLPHAIQDIFSVIDQHHEIDAMIINYAGFQENPERLEKTVLKKLSGLLSDSEAFEHLSTSITFISSLIYRRAKVKLKEQFLENNLPHSYIFLDAIASGKVYSQAEPLLAMRMGNSGGYDFYKVFVEMFENVLNYASSLGFDDQLVNKIRRKNLRTHITVFSIIFKASGAYGDLKINKVEAAQLIRKYNTKDKYANLLANFVLAPDILALPINLVRLARRKLLNRF
jgi:glycosyltransferase involved in cell wall biosynthesis